MTLSQNVRAEPRTCTSADTPVAVSGPPSVRLCSALTQSLQSQVACHPSVACSSPMALTADESLWQSEKFGVFKQNLWKVCLMWQNLHLGKRPGWGCCIPLALIWIWLPCLSLLEGGTLLPSAAIRLPSSNRQVHLQASRNLLPELSAGLHSAPLVQVLDL